MARASTIQPMSKADQAFARRHQNVEKLEGVQVGRFYRLPSGVVQVQSIYRYGHKQPWSARVKTGDGSQTGVPLAHIVKALKTAAHHPVLGCYAQGRAPIRRRKVNTLGVKRRAQKPRAKNPKKPHEFYLYIPGRDRTWLRFDQNGDFSLTREGKAFPTAQAATDRANALRAKHKQLRHTPFLITDEQTWPKKPPP